MVDQARPEWAEGYRADRPTVERKIAHLMRRAWGGRWPRVRGRLRVAADLNARAGAVNLACLATHGLRWNQGGWRVADLRGPRLLGWSWGCTAIERPAGEDVQGTASGQVPQWGLKLALPPPRARVPPFST